MILAFDERQRVWRWAEPAAGQRRRRLDGVGAEVEQSAALEDGEHHRLRLF